MSNDVATRVADSARLTLNFSRFFLKCRFCSTFLRSCLSCSSFSCSLITSSKQISASSLSISEESIIIMTSLTHFAQASGGSRLIHTEPSYVSVWSVVLVVSHDRLPKLPSSCFTFHANREDFLHFWLKRAGGNFSFFLPSWGRHRVAAKSGIRWGRDLF